MENKRIGEIFDEIADIIEIEDSKRIFEIRAYRKAALTIRELQEDVAGILNKKGIKGLMELSGIGEGLAKKIEEYVKTGHIKKYDELKKKYPIDFTSLTKVRGLGSKKAFKLYKELGVKDMKGLQEAIKKNKVRSIEGFGEKSEDVLKKGVASVEAASSRMLLGTALPEAEAILHKLLESKLVERAEIAGSSRRMKETVGDLDILIISEKPEEAMDFATRIDEVESVLLKGPTKSTVWLKIGLSCDIRVVPKESFGAAMQYFIGNKSHNVKVRQIAIKKGYKLNEYGLFDRREKIIESQNEAEIYKILGMAYPVPEMREDRGEIDLALQDKLPVPVALGDICGDLHVHSINSDGADTIEDMALAALKLGYKYIGMTDHSKSEYIARGMDEQRFAKYVNEIEKVNDKIGKQITVFKSAETDILKDGSLDFSKSALKEMDYVLASIHTSLNMDKESMTRRLVSCIESGDVDIIAHPTSRLINSRDPIKLDLDKVFQAAKDNNVVMEVNSQPERLDLNDENIIKAREYGLKFSINTDSHRTQHLMFMRYGVGTARRGWLEKNDVINTLNTENLLKFLKKR